MRQSESGGWRDRHPGAERPAQRGLTGPVRRSISLRRLGSETKEKLMISNAAAARPQYETAQ